MNLFSVVRGMSLRAAAFPLYSPQIVLRWRSLVLRTTPALVLALSMTMEAQQVVGGGQYEYTITNGAVTITQYTGPGGTVAIPANIGGLPVTAVGPQAFFYCTSLTNLIIPNSVISLGAGAFSDCRNLTSVTMGNGLSNIPDNTFLNCSSLGSVAIPNSVTNIGFEAFYDCTGLTTVSIPGSVTSIGEEAFGWCTSLTTVQIPGSVGAVSHDSFDSCMNLSAITVDVLNPFYSSVAGVLFDKTQNTLIQCPGSKAGVFAVPNGVSTIGSTAFHNCRNLTAVTIPNSVTNIGDSAFSSCPNLSAITVDSLNPAYGSLAGVLFDKSQTRLIQCPGATAGTFAVPSSVTNVGVFAFIGCAKITAITVNSANSSYSSLAGVLFNKAQTTLVQCPPALTGNYAVPNGVTNIGAYAFISCVGLTNVSLPNSVTAISAGGFDGCASLVNVTLPSSLTSIGSAAFAGCLSLTNVAIPTGVTSIGSSAFLDCAKLTSVTIPNSVATIADQTFQDCAGLLSVTIGSGVTNIGSLALAFCPSLTSVFFKGNAPTAGLAALGNENAVVYTLYGTSGWGATFAGLPTAFWNPRVETAGASFGVSTNRFGFNITGPTNLFVIVEASSSLANPTWSPLQTNTLAGGYAHFSDPQWRNYPVRFYRLRAP